MEWIVLDNLGVKMSDVVASPGGRSVAGAAECLRQSWLLLMPLGHGGNGEYVCLLRMSPTIGSLVSESSCRRSWSHRGRD